MFVLCVKESKSLELVMINKIISKKNKLLYQEVKMLRN